jgi:glycerate-2-kinase
MNSIFKNLSGVKGMELLSVDTGGLEEIRGAAGALVDGDTLNRNLPKAPQVEYLYDQMKAYAPQGSRELDLHRLNWNRC